MNFICSSDSQSSWISSKSVNSSTSGDRTSYFCRCCVSITPHYWYEGEGCRSWISENKNQYLSFLRQPKHVTWLTFPPSALFWGGSYLASIASGCWYEKRENAASERVKKKNQNTFPQQPKHVSWVIFPPPASSSLAVFASSFSFPSYQVFFSRSLLVSLQKNYYMYL